MVVGIIFVVNSLKLNLQELFIDLCKERPGKNRKPTCRSAGGRDWGSGKRNGDGNKFGDRGK